MYQSISEESGIRPVMGIRYTIFPGNYVSQGPHVGQGPGVPRCRSKAHGPDTSPYPMLVCTLYVRYLGMCLACRVTSFSV